MTHVITVRPKPIVSQSATFRVHQVPAAKDNLVWLIEYEKGKCAAVDGPSAKEVLAYCEEQGLVLTTILNTHTHWDHIGINNDLKRQGQLDAIRVIGAKKRSTDVPGITDPVEDGDQIRLGDLEGTVWLTEGHIDGHLSFLFGEFLFCGDTMFAGGCGYLFDGPPEKMYASLQRMGELSEDTLICCAHEYTEDNLQFALSVEPDNEALQQRNVSVQARRKRGESTLPSTIGLERQSNPFLRARSCAEFTARREEKNTGKYRAC